MCQSCDESLSKNRRLLCKAKDRSSTTVRRRGRWVAGTDRQWSATETVAYSGISNLNVRVRRSLLCPGPAIVGSIIQVAPALTPCQPSFIHPHIKFLPLWFEISVSIVYAILHWIINSFRYLLYLFWTSFSSTLESYDSVVWTYSWSDFSE